jgi:hypothetical protein
LYSQRDPQLRGTAVFLEDGSLRTSQRRQLSPEVQEEVDRIAAVLWQRELYFLEQARRYVHEEELPPGVEPVPESHPSYDPALEQVFAPHPPLLLAREVDVRSP